MPRINLLKNKDIEIFDNPAELTFEEKKVLFTLDFDNNLEPNLRKDITIVGYILQKGYFLSQKKFFAPSQFREEDINYVSKLCGIEYKIDITEYKRSLYTQHRIFILNKFGYRAFSDCIALFEKEALELVKTPQRPKEIFYSLISFLEGESEVKFDLITKEKGTKIRVTHTGLHSFPNAPHFKRERFEWGWNNLLGKNLKTLLEND